MVSPMPSPSSMRPPEMWSRLSAWRAKVAGSRSGDLGDAGAEPQSRRGLGDGAERRPEVEPRIGRIRPVHEVIRDAPEVEAQRLDAAEAFQHRLPGYVGGDEHFEAQGAAHPGASVLPRSPRLPGPSSGGAGGPPASRVRFVAALAR